MGSRPRRLVVDGASRVSHLRKEVGGGGTSRLHPPEMPSTTVSGVGDYTSGFLSRITDEELARLIEMIRRA
jgi:hypothetical protein